LKKIILFIPIFLWTLYAAPLPFDPLLDENVTMEENLSFVVDENDSIETQESFLSSVEYGRMLYKNPRGISCAKCHGKKGQGGQKIAKYYDRNKNPKILKGVDITTYSLDDLNASLINQYREDGHRKRHKIMPMYYLTDEEIEAIYNYLQYDEEAEE
jgi:mono/diheme cytochrome c family protein